MEVYLRPTSYACWREIPQTLVFLLAISLPTGCSWLTWSNSSIRGGESTATSSGATGYHDAVHVTLIEKDHWARKNERWEKSGIEPFFEFEKPVATNIAENCSGNKDCSHEKITYESRPCKQLGSCSADLFVLEFDDQGRLYSPPQMELLFKFLQDTMSPHACNSGEQEPCFDDVSLIVAAHGWRHNADFEDWNLRQLREMLHYLVVGEGGGSPPLQSIRSNPSGKPRKVVGVYLGWRGALIKEYPSSPGIPFTSWTLSDIVLSLPAVLSFGDRKEAAMNVALGSVRELFGELGHIRVNVNAKRPLENHVNRMGRNPKYINKCLLESMLNSTRCQAMRTLFWGHSFGALAIYNAISESLMVSVSGTYSDIGKDELVSSPYADLIVLVNPAFEGTRFEPLYQASLHRMQRGFYLPTQNPVFILIAGTSDLATRWAFPFGQWFGTLFQSHALKRKDGTEIAGRAEEEINASRNTPGHIPRYMTHYLDSFLPSPKIKLNEDTSNIWDDSLAECLTTSWDELTSTGAAGHRPLEEAVAESARVWKEKLQASMVNNQIWPARAYCGGVRLSPAMHEPQEGKDPLKDLPDQSSDQNPWGNQLLSRDIASNKWGPGPRNPYNPIWIVRTKDKRIIDSHNGFFTPSMSGFIRQLYHDVLQ